MDKKQFFKQFHKELAEKYNIPVIFVNILRHYFIHRNFTPNQAIAQLESRSKLASYGPGRRRHSRKLHADLIKFLSEIPKETHTALLQMTKFDKS